jgi:hypothetical protein
VRTEEPPLEVRLALRDPRGRLQAMHLTEKSVRYAYLGERKLTSGDQNFKVFMRDLESMAHGAFFPESYGPVAAGRTMRVRKVFGREQEDNYLRWAVCCAVGHGL